MKTLLFVYFALVLITLSACQKSGKEATVAGVNGQCSVNPSTCPGGAGQIQSNNPIYNQSYGSGYYPYGNQYAQPFNYYNSSAYLCNCPVGTIPTYNGYAGLGCVRTSGFFGGVSGFFYLSWGGNQWNSLNQLYKYNYGSSGSYCYNGAVQSCVVGQTNSCPAGYLCRASTANSSLGLCVTSNR